MSYHETCEFFAIDHALTPRQMRELRAISTRATISPSRFYNFYDWGGLKADPTDMLRRYFDLFVYTCDGTRWAMLRFPADRVDTRTWRAYATRRRGRRAAQANASFTVDDDGVTLSLWPAECGNLAARLEDSAAREPGPFQSFPDPETPDEYDPLDEASWGVPLALLRRDLLAGDLRGLYLAWLCSVQDGAVPITSREPPRPRGLTVKRLTGVDYALAEFLRLDGDLVSIALAGRPVGGRTVGDLLEAVNAREAARRQTRTSAAAKRPGRRTVGRREK